jgi:RimJ/RimL family protein N-acetyltransferase
MTSAAGVRLVPLTLSHASRTRAWANDVVVSRLMNRARPVSESEHQQWFGSILNRTDCLFFAVELMDEARHIGNVWLWDIDTRHRKAELRIVIGEASVRNRGLGSQAIDLICRHGFDNLGLHRVYAYVLSINPGGRRAFERAGFVLEGTLRDDRWADDQFVDANVLARLAPLEG